MKTMEQFWNELTTNKELAEKLAGVPSEQELDELLKENEVDCTAEQFNEFIIGKLRASGELTDEELDEVAGGKSKRGIPGVRPLAEKIGEWLKKTFFNN